MKSILRKIWQKIEPYYYCYSSLFYATIIVFCMLLFLGLQTLTQKKQRKSNHKSFFIGTLHGLAGTSALMLFTLTPNLLESSFFIIIFGIGLIISMVSIALAMHYSIEKTKSKLSPKTITNITASTSILVGIFWLIKIGM